MIFDFGFSIFHYCLFSMVFKRASPFRIYLRSFNYCYFRLAAAFLITTIGPGYDLHAVA